MENKPIECPQQPETNKFKKHATSEICLLPSPSYSRGQACKAQSQHKHFMTLWNHSSNAFAILWQLKGQYSKLMWRVFPKKCCPPDSLLHLPNIHHPHLLRPLHHFYLLYIIIIIIIIITIIITITITITINTNTITITISITIIVVIIIIIITIIINIINLTYTNLSTNLIYLTGIIYNTWITYIIINITTSSTSPTSSKLSNLSSLTTWPSSSSYTA